MDNSTGMVLMSIHPQYVDLINSGEKKIEFRKTRFLRPINKVVIYSTTPVSKIVGYFDVDTIVSSTPALLWEEYNRVGGISEKDFFDYYGSKIEAIGIKIKNAIQFDKKIDISALNLTPPQSYKGLREEEFEKICGFGNL